MKNIITSLFFLMFIFVFINQIYCTDEETSTSVFEKVESGVVYIEQAMFLDSKFVKNINLFKRIEEKLNIKILDYYTGWSSGSGFLITKNGHFITNYHVISEFIDVKKNEESVKSNLIRFFDQFISNISRNIINYDERDKLRTDFVNVLNNTRFVYHVVVNNTDSYEAELLKYDKDLDVALLKVNGEKFSPLMIGDSDKLKVGNGVISIGYPLQGVLFLIFKDLRSTMTTGALSSIRVGDSTSLQHTASINPGNSGGPLLNLQGEVIGINNMYIKSSNSMFFAIPSNKLKNWLQNNNYSDIYDLNQKYAQGLGTKYKLNSDGFLETNKKIFVDLPEGYDIILDGINISKTPNIIDISLTGKHILRIENEQEFCEEKILVNDSSDLFNYNPVLKKHSGSIFVSTDPFKATVFIDDKNSGISPISIKDVIAGKRKITIKMDGYCDNVQYVDVEKNKTANLNIKMEKGYKLIFKVKYSDDTVFEIEKDGIVYKYKKDEKFLLSRGAYKVTINSTDYVKEPFDVVIEDKDVEIYKIPKLVSSRVILKKFIKGSAIIIDNSNDVTSMTYDVSNDIAFDMEIGKHKLEIKNDLYTTINQQIVVNKNKDVVILLTYSIKFSKSYKPIGVGLLVPGIVFTCAGIPLFSYALITSSSVDNMSSYNSYTEYLNNKSINLGLFYGGISGAGLGVGLIIASIPMFAINKPLIIKTKNGNSKVTLNFDVGMKAGIDFGLIIKM